MLLFRKRNRHPEKSNEPGPSGSNGKAMDILKMIAELRQERERIEEVLVALERLARGQGKRRGRPPAWMVALQQKKAAKKAATTTTTGKRRGRPPKNPQPE